MIRLWSCFRIASKQFDHEEYYACTGASGHVNTEAALFFSLPFPTLWCPGLLGFFFFFWLDPAFLQPLTCLLFSDPTDQLRLHCPRAEWQKPLWVLLPCGASRLIPGTGHGGHCQGHGLELRLHSGLWGKLRREWRRCLPADIQRSRYCMCAWLSKRQPCSVINGCFLCEEYQTWKDDCIPKICIYS